MKTIINILFICFSIISFSQTYFYEEFNYKSFKELDDKYENNDKKAFWRTQHAVNTIDINENGKIDKEERYKTTTITKDPFDKTNNIIRFELHRIDPLFFITNTTDDDENNNKMLVKDVVKKYNKKKDSYCTGWKSSPLQKNLHQYNTHMNRNEIAIYGKRRKLYKAKRNHWFGTKMLIDNKYELDDLDNHEIVTQFHLSGKGVKNPPIAIRIEKDRFVMHVIKNNDGKSERYDLGKVVKNKWITWKYHIVLSKKNKKGLIEVWRDGKKMQTVKGKNVFKHYRMYFKIGVYKWGWWDCGLPKSKSRTKIISFDKVWASKKDLN